jgi:hypothetical protein
MPAKILPVANQAPHKTEGLPRRLISGPWSVFSVSGPDVVYLHGGKFLLCKQKKFLLFNFPIACVSLIFQLHVCLQIKLSNNQIVFD